MVLVTSGYPVPRRMPDTQLALSKYLMNHAIENTLKRKESFYFLYASLLLLLVALIYAFSSTKIIICLRAQTEQCRQGCQIQQVKIQDPQLNLNFRQTINIWDILLLKILFVVDPKFKFHWVSCVFTWQPYFSKLRRLETSMEHSAPCSQIFMFLTQPQPHSNSQ